MMTASVVLQMTFFLSLSLLGQTMAQGTRILFPGDPSLNALFGEERACDIPDGGGSKGECLPLEKCPELLELIESRNGIQSLGTVNLLNERICKRLERNVHLCCRTKAAPVRVPAIVPSLKECGFGFGGRISKGHQISHGEHPWLVGLGFPIENDSFKVECGGTLITRKHVLTAAHCFVSSLDKRLFAFPNLTHAILGEHSLSSESERESPLVLRIVELKEPGYDTTTYSKDIALAVLEEEVQFTGYIRPACLPFDNYVEHFDLTQKFAVVGWGRTQFGAPEGTDVPLEVKISIVPKAECKEAYKKLPQLALDDTQVCLGQGGKDACQGDSGGPLIYSDLNKSFRSFVMGVVSVGVGCGNASYPGVYSYVPQFMTWIVDNL